MVSVLCCVVSVLPCVRQQRSKEQKGGERADTPPTIKTTPDMHNYNNKQQTKQLVGLAIGFLQLANPATVAFTNTLKLWLVSSCCVGGVCVGVCVVNIVCARACEGAIARERAEKEGTERGQRGRKGATPNNRQPQQTQPPS